MNTYDGLAARRAGLFYLAAAFFYIFGMMYVDGRVRVAGDAAATLRNIAELGLLYRFGFMSTLLGHVCLLVVAALGGNVVRKHRLGGNRPPAGEALFDEAAVVQGGHDSPPG